MNWRQSVFACLAFPILLGIEASAATTCEQLLSSRDLESSLLSQFDPQKMKIEEVRQLSHFAFYIRTVEGTPYVVRIPTELDDIRREIFAIQFVNSTPGIYAPQVRLLDPKTSLAAVRVIRGAFPETFAILESRWREFNRKELAQHAQLSVSMFYEAPTGSETLAKFGVTDELRELLMRLSEVNYLNDKQVHVETRARIAELWKELDPLYEALLIEDLKFFLPFTRDVPNWFYKVYLIDNLMALRRSDTSALLDHGLKRLPPVVRQQLADCWAAYSILGVPDFHPGNWLLHGNRVICIDLAHPDSTDEEFVEAFTLAKHQHPFGSTDLNDKIRDVLFFNMSARAREYLGSLSRAEILAIASHSEYTLTERELEYIMARVRFLRHRHF